MIESKDYNYLITFIKNIHRNKFQKFILNFDHLQGKSLIVITLCPLDNKQQLANSIFHDYNE